MREAEAVALADFLKPMLVWHHDKRASAQQMLNHPWLSMEPNYNTKYTEKEFTIIKLKKEMKFGVDYVTADLLLDDPKQEMNQLIESDQECYQPDSDDSEAGGHSQTPSKFNDDLDSEEFDVRERRMEKAFENNKKGEERSLQTSREGRTLVQ